MGDGAERGGVGEVSGEVGVAMLNSGVYLSHRLGSDRDCQDCCNDVDERV